MAATVAIAVPQMPMKWMRCIESEPGVAAPECRGQTTAASSMTSAGAPRATTVARTPNGSVIVAPGVWPDGKPASTGPGKPSSTRAIASSAADPAVGLVAVRAAR